ncbi:MAG: CPBP family intramembrane metalloprotease [Candidatus Nomurabacteria bacterium]|jgi:membrane protease YdiL (CAAX protease family)|nr:CPBP family intramembrane metalloprotease [Candidatus Nomurabacteria bacterium]
MAKKDVTQTKKTKAAEILDLATDIEPKAKTGQKATGWQKKLIWAGLHCVGVLAAYYIVQYTAAFVLYFIYGDNLKSMANDPVFNTVVSAVVSAILLVVVLIIPWKAFKQKLSAKELGVNKWPSWTDILLSPAAFLVYMVGAALLTSVVSALVPGFDVDQVQNIGYTADNLVQQSDYLLAFAALVVVAPVVEEVIFRGYLYGKLRSRLGIVLSMLLVSVLFGAAHGQWNVGVNVFVMSLVMCGLREITGSIWAGVLLHMLKNGIAYYLLFVNTSFLNSVVGG